MKIYKVTYDGLWMGGVAIVLAQDAKEAIELARHDRTSVHFKDIATELIVDDLTEATVIYNDNGNY
jgi:hypothetical protein